MPPVESELDAVRRQLEKVLASPGFARNERLSRFLRFVVERHLDGRDQELKESVLALEIFGRGSDHNPRQDAIVRTEAGRLRARLSEYYLCEGKGDQLVIELPKGGYVPKFVQAEQSQTGRRVTIAPRWIAAALVALTLSGFGWWRIHRRNAPVPIAVLPLVNVSQDPANEYFADGLTGEIIRNLSIIDGLAVRSQTSSFAFKGKPRNVREAGNQLAADYILEGSVLRDGQRVRINAQLVRAKDDFPLWSERYDRQMADIFAIQDEISRGIVNSLRLKLGLGRRRYETSPDAYDLYLRARAPWVRNGWSKLSRAVEPFEAVIAKDASFAPAYADLAAAHVVRSAQPRFDIADELSKMRAAAQKAIQLDPLLPEAHDALALACSRDAQWEQAEKSFRRAIQLDPNCAIYYGHFAMYLLLPVGRTEEAIQQLRLAENADPVSYEMHFDAAYVLFAAGRYNEAAAHCDKLPADAPDKTWCLARVAVDRGKIAEGIRILEAPENLSYDSDLLGYAYARAGRPAEAEKVATRVRDQISQARILAGLGDADRTMEALERGAVLGAFRLGRALAYPEFRFLRGDPRLKALCKKVGLPE